MLTALLCWYDEHPGFLVRAVYTATRLGVRRVIALDGAYALYPGGRAHSPSEQAQRVNWACSQMGLDVHFGKPRVWGTEMEKRDHALQLAEKHGSPDDWILWLDADFEVVTSNPTLPVELSAAYQLHGYEAAEVMMRTLKGAGYFSKLAPFQALRWLFRLGEGLHFGDNHYTIVTGDGRRLWGNAAHGPVEPALDLTGQVGIVHHTNARPEERVRRQIGYYNARDQAGVERAPCGRCGGPSVGWAPTNFRDAPPFVEGDWIEVCEPCSEILAVEARETFARLGGNLDELPKMVRPGYAASSAQ